MPKAYIVVKAVRREDVPAWGAYLDRFRETLASHKGRVLIGTEQRDRRIGELNFGRLVIEFADMATALAAYEEYVEDVIPLRPDGTSDLFIVEVTE